ncbi:MAG TPA: ATP-dependent DNA ligase [Nitrospirales bacterium]|nr:ATP-dependent DNA ligase [Nitrospirales bacterium]
MPRVSAPKIAETGFPKLDIPLPLPYPPMESRRAEQLPEGDGWVFEPKWDGFRCLVFRDDTHVVLQSKAGQPLGRYFPELVEAFRRIRGRFVLDGEIIVVRDGHLSFDDLLQRIHPAESRIRRLAAETPTSYLAFDLLYDPAGGRILTERPLRDRRARLEVFMERVPEDAAIYLSPSTGSRATARQWFTTLGGLGFDGVMAKRADERYHPGDRDAMVKVKHLKTADCVVGGFRWTEKKPGVEVGSLLLGLYDADGLLQHVGHAASFTKEQRRELTKTMEPLKGGAGFSGRAPGGPSRWSTTRTGEWEPVDPRLVCEVQYDYFTRERFRHGTKFLRWRPDKKPTMCTFEALNAERGLPGKKNRALDDLLKLR